MLADYKNKQENAYRIFSSAIENNYISHAYLIDENNCDLSFDIVLSFVKEVLARDLEEEEKTVLFKRIDDGNYQEIKVIVPDGNIIKKQQILDLQHEFSTKSIEGSKRVYIIRDADKMRSETANSMLKFLEEPDNDILAIIMTNKFSAILPTIISRCQIIKLNNNEDKIDDEMIDLAINFVYNVEKNGIKTILRENELLNSSIGFKERDKFELFFEEMIEIYYNIMKVYTGNNIKYSSYIDKLKEIANMNNISEISRKIDYLVKAKSRIKNNVNLNLLVDDLIINIGGNNEGSWS